MNVKPMEIKDVFGAQPKSVWEYLCENGQGLYVPAYQRQYSWDKTKISRLFEDTCHGFTMLIDHSDSITFLGTIIAIHDTQYLTVNPLVKGDVPSRVMTIIDGQQRLTTLLLINTVLHEEIRGKHARLKVEDQAREWLKEECMKVLGRLAKTFEEDKDYGDEGFRFYPRMIRAYEDSWSRKKDKAQYKSPIGFYLHTFGIHGRGDPKKSYKFQPPEGDQSDKQKYRLLGDGRRHVQSLIRTLSKNDQLDLELPSFDSILKASNFQEILVKSDFPEQVHDALTAEGGEDFKELLYLVLFANFILDRVALTIVTAKNEDYAFDMFEALNTTGEPLTAFETFKPRVIHSEGLEHYENSQSYEYMNAIESYLEGYGKTDEKQDATSRLIVTFALAERGEKLSKRLSDQRRFFKESFEKLPDEESRRNFIRHLAHTAIFVQHSWPDENKALPKIDSAEDAEKDEVILCLDLLRSFKHTIILSPLIRFYSEIRKAGAENRSQAIEAFITATKAITAFSVLWRSSRRGTANIDAYYRKLMESGHDEISMPALCRRLNNNDMPTPNADQLKQALKSLLQSQGGINNKNDWVKEAAKIPAYTNQKEITRFILLAAAHDSVDDKDSPGLTVAGRSGILPLLNLASWRDENAQTVEHIAPQTREEGWLNELYDDSETINRLGNLTLLPHPENASIGNRPWPPKKLIYKILSTETADELGPLIAQAKTQGIEFSQSTTELLANSRHLPMAKAVARVEGDWTLDLVERRSIRIAELAWTRIAPWLDLPE